MKAEVWISLQKDPFFKTADPVMDVLLKNGVEIFIPEDFPKRYEGVCYGFCPDPDILIVLGGDGSIMKAARRGAAIGAPILGINLGRLGYLAELAPSDMEGLIRVINGEYTIEKRMMLEVSTSDKCGTESSVAVNDVVITHGNLSHMLETEIYCDGSSMGRYRSDGFIVSTPTGSTAYSLAAGGPVIAPNLKGVCLTPICPHSLMARPIIVSDDSVIEIKYVSPSGPVSYLSVDGVECGVLPTGQSLIIKRSELTADFVRVNKELKKSFYDVLREKMSDI